MKWFLRDTNRFSSLTGRLSTLAKRLGGDTSRFLSRYQVVLIAMGTASNLTSQSPSLADRFVCLGDRLVSKEERFLSHAARVSHASCRDR
jgi:hypothetical protein